MQGNSVRMEALDYGAMVEKVLSYGDSVESRAGPTSEMLGMRIAFPAGQLFYRPGMSRALGWVESLQVIGGVWDDGQLMRAAPAMRWEYGVTHAYGLRVATQLPKLVSQLKSAPGTRRALVWVGSPADGFEEEKPCPTLWQFLSRVGRLDMVAYLRSWDLVSGFPYDTMVMSAVLCAVAGAAEMVPGTVVAVAGSAHVYLADLARVPEPNGADKRFSLPVLPSWSDYVQWAREGLDAFPWGGPPPGVEVKDA